MRIGSAGEGACRTADAGWTSWIPSTPDIANKLTNERIFFTILITFRVELLFPTPSQIHWLTKAPPPGRPKWLLDAADGFIRREGQLKQKLYEASGLADKQAIIGQSIHEVDSVGLALARWTNYRNERQTGADEFARN